MHRFRVRVVALGSGLLGAEGGMRTETFVRQQVSC